MKIQNNPALIDDIKQIIDINNININVADMLMTAFSYVDIFNPDEIKQYIKEGLKEEEAILEILYDFYQLDKNNEDNNIIMDEFFLNNLKRLDEKEYLNNPYVLAIKETGKYQKYALKKLTYEPYQLFAYDEIKVNKDYKEYSAIGYFNKPFSYLALTEGNNVWMSLNPNEIETMKPYIKKAKGHVLVLGLGLGYVPFMMANKKEVHKITIIEKDPDIIALFNKLIFPSFTNKNKIETIKDDAINFVKNHQKYDYIFADLWHDPEDGLDPFIKLKRINKNIDCWLETSLLALLRRCMITLLEETMNGSKEEDYRFAKTTTDKVINTYYHKTKNILLKTKEDVDSLLKAQTLLDLLFWVVLTIFFTDFFNFFLVAFTRCFVIEINNDWCDNSDSN